MKYLAFDIEAANGYQLSSICSIGIVVADEQFNIISRQNIWINPKTKFNLNGTRQNVGIDLHLDKKLLNASPDFKQVYGKVSGLLTDREYFVFGHAVDADVRMLNAACAKNRLTNAPEIGVEFQEHNSEEDAYATMQTLKYLVQASGTDVNGLMQKYRIRIGSNRNFELIRPVSLEGQVSKKRVTQVACDKIKKYASTVKKVNGKYKDVGFSLSRALELSDDETLYKVIEIIIKNGGRYATKLVKSKIYIYGDDTSEQDLSRERRVNELAEQGLITKISAKQFIEENI